MSENIVNKINVNGKEYEVQSKIAVASGEPYTEFNLSTLILGSGLSVVNNSTINLDIRGISHSEVNSSSNGAQINLGSGLCFSKDGTDENIDYIKVNIGSSLFYTDNCDGRGVVISVIPGDGLKFNSSGAISVIPGDGLKFNSSGAISVNPGDGLKLNSMGQLCLNSNSSSSGNGFALSSSNVGKGLSLDYSLSEPTLYLSTIRGVNVGYYGQPSEILLGTGLKFSEDPTMPTKECIEVAIGTGLVISNEYTIIPDIKGVEYMPGSDKMEIKLHPDDFYFDENGYVRIKKS